MRKQFVRKDQLIQSRENKEAESQPLSSVVADHGAADAAIAAWEVASVVVSVLIAEWVILAFIPNRKIILAVPVVMAISQILYSERQRGETRREIGWRLDNLLPALRLLAIPTAVAAILILGTGWWNATIRLERHNFYFWLMGLVLWALAQQFVLQGFMNRRFQLIYGKGKTSVVCVAVIFAILHLPNPLLCVLTFVSALLWGFAYQRYPNLFAVALSHATLSCLLAISLPNWLLNNLRVGFKYFG